MGKRVRGIGLELNGTKKQTSEKQRGNGTETEINKKTKKI
jgi:hypothetical protein